MKPHSLDQLARSTARVSDESLSGYAGRPAARGLLEEITTLPESQADKSRSVVPSRGLRLTVAGAALATAVSAGTIVVWHGDGDPAAPPGKALPSVELASAAETSLVLDKAAKAAAASSVTVPSRRQWVYTRMRETSSAKPGGMVTGGPYRTDDWELWRRADGKQFAAYRNGTLEKGHETVGSAVVARYLPLPTDPAALLRKVGGNGPGGPQMAYETLVTLLRDDVHPPAVEAAIFRAIKLVPGVTLVKARADALGRPALALGITNDWVHQEVLLDARTYGYLGERTIAIKDYTARSEGEPTRRIPKGTVQHLMVRLSIKVVNGPGQRS
ncbi:CU044_5270 family protein [Actinomadura barringtoniae]|uniref:CU044_5270 family protein n=1 Tax=Actinomadura barringtoniae TaxID=1427535 RepID=A0A939P8L7_9ACTN|nr:CU044_5270 family protein [Actinomadura barringtoniae]MBO2447733.1 CU044_5270 family protein [Actinomadura barringtoniae]